MHHGRFGRDYLRGNEYVSLYAPIERAVAPVDPAVLRACAGAYEVTIDAKTKQRLEVVVAGAVMH